MIRCVVFDLDGTLVDTGDLFYRLFAEVVRLASLAPVEFRKTGDQWQSAHAQTVARHPGLRGVTAQPSFSDAWDRVLRELLREKGINLYPGALGLLEGLRAAGRKICLASNTPKRFVEVKLAHFDLGRFFDAVFTPQDVWGPKPRPESLFHAMQLFGLAAHEIVMVGDHDQDVIYGKNAGVNTIGILNQYNSREELVSAGPDWIVEDLGEVMGIVDGSVGPEPGRKTS